MTQWDDRAARGAALLDEKKPGWWRKIRRTDLNMNHGFYRRGECGCILAQLYPEGWNEGLNNLRVRAHTKYGFGVEPHEFADEPKKGPLRAAWLTEIRKRASRRS